MSEPDGTDESDESGRTITLGKMIAYPLGVLLIIVGLGATASSPIGVFVLIGGFFALPVVRRKISTRTGVTFSTWATVLIVVVLVGMGGAALPSGDSPDASATAGSGPDDGSGDESETLTHNMGDSFTVGSGDYTVQYQVEGAYTTQNLGNQYVSTSAEGEYLILVLNMENVGDESFDVSDRHFRAVDDQDREFKADFGAANYVEDDPRFDTEGVTHEQLNPGLDVTRAVVFDVNPEGEYKLQISPVGVFSTADTHQVELTNVEDKS